MLKVKEKEEISEVYNNTAVALAYVAGMVDGEGCISARYFEQNSIHNDLGYSNIRMDVRIYNKNRESLELCQQVIGGTLYQRVNTHWILYLTNRKQMKAGLLKILPYLIIKRCQAELLLELIDLRSDKHHGFTEREIEIIEEFRTLNKKGYP